jgi:ATP-binding cassette subfamily C protein LapB
MGAPHLDDAELLKVANISGVTPFVQRHPMGFDMSVGERGENLSGGQRQAISVARALINAPGLFVMDEPTNSMDNTSESILRKNLATVLRGKTSIIATHRSSLLELVDRLIVLDSGAIVADGDKDTVVQLLKEGRLKTG